MKEVTKYRAAIRRQIDRNASVYAMTRRKLNQLGSSKAGAVPVLIFGTKLIPSWQGKPEKLYETLEKAFEIKPIAGSTR